LTGNNAYSQSISEKKPKEIEGIKNVTL